jgi:hypothetical protein
MMKAISLWQPHASLIGRGKLFETRSWQTPYRGKIAIHAGKNTEEIGGMQQRIMSFKERSVWTEELRGDTFLWEMAKSISEWGKAHGMEAFRWKDFPFGAVVAIGDLTEIYATRDLHLEGVAALFGDFTPGRYAWKIGNVQILKTPYTLRGQQGLWDLPPHITDDLLSAEKWEG